MNTLCRLLIVSLTSSLLVLSIQAQTGSWHDFDPSPLRIDPVARTPPRAVTINDILAIRDFKGLQISPDGKQVAYIVSQAVFDTNAYRTALFVVSTDPGSVPRNLGSAGPPHWDYAGQFRDYVLRWSPDSRYLTGLVKLGGTWQVWRWDQHNGKPEQLTHNALDVQDYDWSSDGSKIIFSVTEPVDFNEARRISEQGFVYDGTIQPWKGKPVLQAVLDAKPRKTQFWVYKVATKTEREASTEETLYKKAQSLPAGSGFRSDRADLSASAKSIAYVKYFTDQTDYYSYALFIKKLNEEKPRQLTPISTLPIYNVWWSKDGDKIYFNQSTEDGRRALFMMPATGGVIREVTRSEDQLDAFSFDKDRSRAVCIRQNATSPPELAIVDLMNGIPRTVTNINPEFQNIKLGPATRLEWVNRYGDKASGYFLKPLNYEPGKRYPLIVTTYRASGFLRGATGDEYPIQAFAAEGFAVLAFDAPPSRTDKPGDFDTQILTWRSPMASLETGIKMLDETGFIDPNRRGLTGLSFGAEITQFTISNLDLFQAAATSGLGARDPFFYYLADNAWHKLFATWGIGGWPEGETAKRWKEMSPSAERIKAPLLVQAPDDAYIISLALYTSLKELHKPVELVIYPNEFHVKNQPKHRYYIYQRNLDWFNFWLKGEEDPDPAKAEQYKRWRELRKLQQQNEKNLPAPGMN